MLPNSLACSTWHESVRHWIFIFLVLTVSSGCRKSEPEEIFAPENWQGEINTELPKETQAQQDAIIRLLGAIQLVGIEHYHWDCPDIKFNVSFAEFFEDAVGIHKWEWSGEPSKNGFPVRLFLEKDDPTEEKTIAKRIFTVTRRGRSFLIEMKNASADEAKKL